MTISWASLSGYPRYEISSEGDVYDFKKHRQLKQYKCAGYFNVTLVNWEGIRKEWPVHQLVARTFIPNPERKLTVNHENGIKTDNRVSNLSWMTVAENSSHTHETGLISPRGKYGPRSKLDGNEIRSNAIDTVLEDIENYIRSK